MKTISLGLYDDHPFIVEGIQKEIANNHKNLVIFFTANTKQELLDALLLNQPEILVLDIVSEEVRGLENFETVLSLYPNCKIIAFSSLNSVTLVENLISLGVKGFVNKKQKTQDLISCILEVADNKISVPEDYQFITSKYNIAKTAILTDREIDIVNRIGNEDTTAEIAEKLCLSVNTIESHRKRIFQKLNVKNVAGMIMESSRLGYLK